MKKMILGFILLLTFNTTFAKTLIVSDIDDTVKVTDVLGMPSIIINGLFSVKEFSGMSELYRELNTNETAIYYVSGSPKMFKKKVDNFLSYNNFPQSPNLIMRKLGVTTSDFKLSVIRELIIKTMPDKIILFGDDTEFDPEVYDTLSKENEGKVESIYIRSIQNRRLPNNDLIKTFFASVEIAAFELFKGNLSESGFKKITTSFMNQANSSKVVIRGRYCPIDGRSQIEELKHMVNQQSAIDILNLTQQKIVKTCKDERDQIENDHKLAIKMLQIK